MRNIPSENMESTFAQRSQTTLKTTRGEIYVILGERSMTPRESKNPGTFFGTSDLERKKYQG